jgi:hypothetical protein
MHPKNTSPQLHRLRYSGLNAGCFGEIDFLNAITHNSSEFELLPSDFEDYSYEY